MLSQRDGAVVGICSSLTILLFLILGAPNTFIVSDSARQAGLIAISANSATRDLFQKQPIQNFQPITIIEVFRNYFSVNATSHWANAFIHAGRVLEKFLYDMNLWILPALWCVSGYIASKSFYWYGKFTKYPLLLACITASLFPIVGYAISSPAINPYMIFGAIAVPILMALAATPIYFLSQMMKLQNQEAEIKTKLEDIKAKILKISELGYNIKTLEKRLDELNLGISDPKMSEFYKNKMFQAAATHLNNIMGDSLKLEEETDNLLNRIAQIEEKVHSIESNIDEIKSIIRKTEKLIYQVSMSEERKELEEIQKRLTNITNMAKKGLFEEALNNLETLKTKSETLDDEVSEIYEFWSKVPQWSKAIEEKLKAEGKAELKAISEIPEKWKNQAANYFLKERKDEELTFKNGVIYSSKIIPSPATAKKEIESIEIKTTVTKPTPKEEIDTKVFRYIQEHQGTISIKKALEDLKLSEEEFRESVRRLKEKRLIE
ncbi:MAG: hypothetical protein QW791_07520 [Candidatus Bathyarchaeia archaeon]